jgi:hypothetical protein
MRIDSNISAVMLSVEKAPIPVQTNPATRGLILLPESGYSLIAAATVSLSNSSFRLRFLG